VRKAFVVVGIALALGVCAATASAGIQPVICGTACDGGGGGWTGCTQLRVDHAAGLPYLSHVDHFLVVGYCKSRGIITSISIAAHDCSVGGLAFCHVGSAWQTGGGVGSGWATFEAHATWGVTVVPLYNNSDTLTLTVPLG